MALFDVKYDEHIKKWCVVVKSPELEVKVGDDNISFLSSPYPLEKCGRITAGCHEFIVELAYNVCSFLNNRFHE